jgi:hypothetical protein
MNNNSTSRYANSTREWYVIHTYSGYEEKVAESIKQRIGSLDMADKIFEVLVPKEKMIEIKNGKRRVVEKKIFQGYVLVILRFQKMLGILFVILLVLLVLLGLELNQLQSVKTK